MRSIFTALILTVSLSQLVAQPGIKIGHLNFPEIIQKLPELDSIRIIIDKESNDLEQLYNDLLKEYDMLYNKYEAEKASYSEFIKQQKENEIKDKAAKIQQFNQEATQQLEKRSIELQQPIYDKVNKAITSVATRENFTYILDLSNGTVVFKSPGSLDVTSMVMEELNLETESN